VSVLPRDGYGPIETTRAPSGVFTEWAGRSGISTRAVKPATTPVPSPMAVVGVVSSIIPERALVVRISDTASGYERSAWRTAHQALRAAEQNGWRTSDPTVWASTPQADRVASAVAGDPIFGGLLRFVFYSEAPYMQLVGQPGLTAFVMVDRGTQRFLSVKFKNR
jgi:hypothetical protein